MKVFNLIGSQNTIDELAVFHHAVKRAIAGLVGLACTEPFHGLRGTRLNKVILENRAL